MKKLLKFNQEVYLLEDGLLKKLGEAEDMVCVSENVYSVGHDVYLKDGNKFELIAQDVVSDTINFHASVEIGPWAQFFTNAKCAVPSDKVNPNLWSAYLKFLKQRTDGQADGAVVIAPRLMNGCYNKVPQLFFYDKGFLENFNDKLNSDGLGNLAELDAKSVLFLGRSAFVYKGFVYTKSGTRQYYHDDNMQMKVRRDCWTKVHNALILSAKEYLLFYCGNYRIFALEQEGDKTIINSLGEIRETIKTEVGELFVVSDCANKMFKLYYLGDKLELLATYEIEGNCTVDTKTGNVSVHRSYLKLDDNGQPVTREDGEYVFINEDIECIFENGHYKKSVR